MVTKIWRTETKTVVYKEDMPSSDKKTRVLAIIQGEEDSEAVKTTYLSYQDEMSRLEALPIAFSYPGGQNFTVEIKERYLKNA